MKPHSSLPGIRVFTFQCVRTAVALSVAAAFTTSAAVASVAAPLSAPAVMAAVPAATAEDPMPPIIGEWAAAAPAVSGPDLVSKAPAAANPLAIGTFIVTAASGKLDDVLAAHTISPTRIYRSALQGFDAKLTARQLAALRADNRVVSVSRPQTVTGFAQTIPPVITRLGADAAPAWAGTGRASSAELPAVAVVDSGVELHPDLNVVEQVNCSSELSATDLGGHGTGVSGVLAARDNTSGIVGIAPGAPVYSVKVMNKSNQGTTDTLLCGLNWVSAHAAEKNIKVVNLSLGVRGADDGQCGVGNSDPIHMAICSLTAKGVSVVAAAGHISADLAGTIPAAYDEVLAATNMADWDGKPGGLGTPPCSNQTGWIDDRPASDTNFAVSAADIAHTVAAPGACPYTTLRGGRYGYLAGGTSMAAAATSGVVLNCLRPEGACAGKTPAETRQIVIDQAKNAALTSNHGYTGDPRTSTARYYGWLVTAKLQPLSAADPVSTPTPTPTPAPPAAGEPDTTAPTVRLTSPGPGTRVSGTVELQATASDNVGVTGLTFLLGDVVVGQGTKHPDGSWRANLDSTRFANNAYVLRASAVDAAGNTGSGSHKIRVENIASPAPAPAPGEPAADTVAPTVAVTSPTSGARLSGTVRMTATASDNVGVTAVTFWVRTTLVGTGALQPDGSWQATVNTAGFANGTYDMTAKASDAAGNQGTSSPVTVQVAN